MGRKCVLDPILLPLTYSVLTAVECLICPLKTKYAKCSHQCLFLCLQFFTVFIDLYHCMPSHIRTYIICCPKEVRLLLGIIVIRFICLIIFLYICLIS